MDFWRTVMVLLRRWYITVPAFFATLFLAAAGASLVPLQYQSTSILVLTTPLSGGTELTNTTIKSPLTNPMLNFDRSLALSASIVIQQMSSSETAVALGITPRGPISFEVTNGSSNPELLESGPFIFVTGTGPSPEAAQDITETVSARAAAVLAQRQVDLDAPASTYIDMQTVVPPTVGQPLTGSPLRAAAAVGGLAALASLASVFGFESMMTHRRRRRAEKARAAAQDDPGPTTAPGADDDEAGAGGTGARGGRSTRLVDRRKVNGTARAGSGSPVGVLESLVDDDEPEPEGR